jgi:phospholipid transport system substrate-binding protein
MKKGFIFRMTISALLICGALHAASAQAAAPTEQLKTTIDTVIKLLNDETLKRPEKFKERRALLRKAIIERFDFTEMSKRSLAAQWAKRTPQEKKEFVDMFTNLLEKSYMDKIEAYTDQTIEYNGESIDNDYVVVKTMVKAKDKEGIPIDYKLTKQGDQWLVYDVVVEGVSLVNNYRNQFNKIINSGSYADLVKKMKIKEAEILQGPSSSGKKKSTKESE